MIAITGGTTKLAARQIRLTDLFSVERVLASRGFEIEVEGDANGTLLPKDSWTQEEEDLIFRIFDNVEDRQRLLGSIESKGVDGDGEILSYLKRMVSKVIDKGFLQRLNGISVNCLYESFEHFPLHSE